MRNILKSMTLVCVLACVLVFGLGLSQALASSHMKDAGQAEFRVGLMIGSMQADMLEGVEEAFGYLLLNSKLEKSEFFDKMRDFDAQAKEFKKLAKKHFRREKHFGAVRRGASRAPSTWKRRPTECSRPLRKPGAPVQADIMMFEDGRGPAYRDCGRR